MRLLFISHSRDLYGASRSMLRIAKRLASERHDVAVVLPGPGPLLDALREAKVETIEHPWLGVVDRGSFRSVGGLFRLVLSVPVSIARLGSIFGAWRPDVVHTNSSVVFASGPAARLRGVPHVWHVRESYDDFPSFWKLYRRFMLAFADLLPCISRAVADQFAGAAKARVLHNGYPREEFDGVALERIAQAEERLGPGRPLVTLVGRIKLKRKGQETLVRAAALLHGEFPAARFPIVGAAFPGNELHEEELRREIAERGLQDVVRLTGEIHDAPAVFAASDIAVMASGTPEPLGGVTIEAMAMAKPVVGTNIGGTPEIVVDGETGLLVPPNDPEAMAAALRRLLADPALAARMGAAGRRRYEEAFAFDAFYAKLLALYREVGS